LLISRRFLAALPCELAIYSVIGQQKKPSDRLDYQAADWNVKRIHVVPKVKVIILTANDFSSTKYMIKSIIISAK